jgi:hypothetical protein
MTDGLSQFRSEQKCHVEGTNKQEVLNWTVLFGGDARDILKDGVKTWKVARLDGGARICRARRRQAQEEPVCNCARITPTFYTHCWRAQTPTYSRGPGPELLLSRKLTVSISSWKPSCSLAFFFSFGRTHRTQNLNVHDCARCFLDSTEASFLPPRIILLLTYQTWSSAGAPTLRPVIITYSLCNEPLEIYERPVWIRRSDGEIPAALS